MDAPTVPEDDVSRIGTWFGPLATPVVEPLHVFLGIMEGIPPIPSTGRHLVLVGLEEFVVQIERAFEYSQTPIIRTVW